MHIITKMVDKDETAYNSIEKRNIFLTHHRRCAPKAYIIPGKTLDSIVLVCSCYGKAFSILCIKSGF